MGCLFLLSVLLAIPTYGLSLVAFMVYAIARAVLTAEARMRSADAKRAYRETETAKRAKVVAHTNAGKLVMGNAIWQSVVEKAEARGVPAVYTNTIILAPEFADFLKEYLDNLRDQGAMMFGEQMASASFVKAAWDRMTDEQKAPILEIAATGVRELDPSELNFD